MAEDVQPVEQGTVSRRTTPIAHDEHGNETHPAWVVIGASRVSHSPPGAILFDSDVRHQHYVVIAVSEAKRKRELHRDWVGGGKRIVELAMSEAQWASFVSAMNSGVGVPATLQFREGADDPDVPGLPYDPRLAHSINEVRDAADRAQLHVLEAFKAYKEHKTVANLRTLQAAIENMTANIEFSARSLAEHAENVVQRAKADIEAFVVGKARQLGIDPAEMEGRLELGRGGDEVKDD